MRVLITNASLGSVGGTQACVRDLAIWLQEQGHLPVVFGPNLGETARQIARRTIPVTDDIRTVSVAPDIIHGNSAEQTMVALLHFPETPGIFVCHSWRGSASEPPQFPRLLQYVAVDDTCADRLLCCSGVDPNRVSVLLNAVDIQRFTPRNALPSHPRRALVFSNTAHELTHLSVVREACASMGIAVDAIGRSVNREVAEPETVLGNYDLVFAKAKCALEAMASGTAVVLCDAAGLGGMVKSHNLQQLRRLNFGIRSLRFPVTVETVRDAISGYDPNDARAVCDGIRNSASATVLHSEFTAMYHSVMDEFAQSPRNRAFDLAESRAAAAFIVSRASQHTIPVQTSLLVQASQRILSNRVVGPPLTKALRRMLRRS